MKSAQVFVLVILSVLVSFGATLRVPQDFPNDSGRCRHKHRRRYHSRLSRTLVQPYHKQWWLKPIS
jgi:hypothetical protein